MGTKKNLFQKVILQSRNETTLVNFFNQYNIIKIIIILLTIFLIFFFVVFRINHEDEFVISPVQVGTVWPHKTLIAEYTFPIFKSRNTYLQEIKKVRENVLPVFIRNPNAEHETLMKIDSLWSRFIQTNYNESVLGENFQSANAKLFFENISSEKINELQKALLYLKERLPFYFAKIIINTNLKHIQTTEIVIISNNSNIEKIIPKRNVYDLSRLERELRIDFLRKFKSDLVEVVVELLPRVIVFPYEYSSELTQKKTELAIRSVPKTLGYVKSGNVVIEKGKKITEDDYLKLISFQKVKMLIQGESSSFWMLIGAFLNVVFIYSIIFIYLFILRKRIFADNLQFGIINLCLVLVSFFSWLSITIPSELPLGNIILLPALSILIAIVFDSRTAFYSTITMAILVALIRGNDFETASTLMFSGIIGAYSVRDIQNRAQMFRSMVFIEIGFLVPILSFSLQKVSEWINFAESLSLATLNAVTSPMITYGLLYIIEKYSNITTDLKLKEFDNLNHPLLKKLSEIAPGTYQHTMQVAMLAESCAAAVGANTLLTRVGAYFHDIGKLYNPEYFIENQIDIENKHQYISPRRSAEAIKEHVLKGIEIAKEFNVPQRIIDFIPMHHGTSLIKHFYALALEESGDRPVDDTLFRYPGPKPNTKEAVIVMICDSAEAMSRLANRSREELSNMVHRMIQDKLIDGQFDDSNITMKDLKVIEEVVARILFGSTHPRVEYKDIPKTFGHSNNE